MPLYERRIGERKPFVGFPALVAPLRKQGGSRPRRRPRRFAKVHGLVLDMSLSGASVEAPARLGLAIGGLVEVRIDTDRWFVGRIKRLAPTHDGERVHCGVAYDDISDAYRDWLNEWTDQLHDPAEPGTETAGSPDT